MSELECQYCKHTFSNKQNLKQHQTTAKFCLDKQNLEGRQEIKCECLKTFTTQSNLDRHRIKCDIKKLILQKDKEILEKDNENSLLKMQLSTKDEEIKNFTAV